MKKYILNPMLGLQWTNIGQISYFLNKSINVHEYYYKNRTSSTNSRNPTTHSVDIESPSILKREKNTIEPGVYEMIHILKKLEN